MKPATSASTATVRRLIRARLVAVGLFAPWQGKAPSTTEGDVADTWAAACRSRGVTEDDLEDALTTFADRATKETRWPAPADVLPERGGVHAAQPVVAAGCGRCTAEGFREFAWHHTDRDGAVIVDTMVAHCSCYRGEHYRQQRALPLKGKGGVRRSGVSLDEAVATYRNRASTVAVYIDPTAEQRRPRPATGAHRPPVATKRGPWRPAVDWTEPQERWTGEPDADEVGS